ncbi:MAG: magnesium/cobalt transporter CorA [Gemmatimonadota bacterium]|nr:magnesium/cobalt transporter CorA [Gemmatimonadota bacterium]
MKRRASRLLGARARSIVPGSAPGEPRFDPEAPPPTIRAIGFRERELEEEVLGTAEEASEWLDRWPFVWLDVVGFGRGPELETLSEVLGLHPLAMEDVVNLGQRPKVETYPEHLFAIVRMAHAEEGDTEQLSLFIGDGWVLTVQQREGDPFEGVRTRLREPGRRIRASGADYLGYALLDAIIDSYFPALDGIGDRLEALEDEVLNEAGPETSQRIHTLRRTLLGLRKSIVPHRDACYQLAREEHPRITPETQVFLRDVYDHVLRLTDLVETYRELTSDMMSLYMTVVSNRMNEIMKVLTIIASIFIPLSFIAGLYGMNFDPSASSWNMPELGWRFGYVYALGLMLAVGGGFLWFVWRKGWLD